MESSSKKTRFESFAHAIADHGRLLFGGFEFYNPENYSAILK